ncbi:MAG: hydroxyethylthiazole kinase [Deltaproteobacteria bacterium]|nr:hydroxyethylthiazole kinase [Deltaproteobacteria bacterium]
MENIQEIREAKPLIHHLTNWVTIYDCAQITRATGALPVMAHAKEEVEEMVMLAGALVLNIGTLTSEFIESAALALKKADEKGIPVVLDGVGVGATELRTKSSLRLINEGRIAVIKGNAGEIATLSGAGAEVKGVESVSVEGSIEEHAKSLALRTGSVVAVTGKEDFVTDGERTARVLNGHSLMGEVVGTGCMAASVIGSFVSVSKNAFTGTVCALSAYGIAGEIAAEKANAPMEFKHRLMDAVYGLNEDNMKRARVVI